MIGGVKWHISRKILIQVAHMIGHHIQHHIDISFMAGTHELHKLLLRTKMGV